MAQERKSPSIREIRGDLPITGSLTAVALVECFAGMFARATMRLRNTKGLPGLVSVRCCERPTSARLVNFGVDQTNQRFGGRRETNRRRGAWRDQTPSPRAGGRRRGEKAKRPAESRENAHGVRDGGHGRGSVKKRERRFALAGMVERTFLSAKPSLFSTDLRNPPIESRRPIPPVL
jgi:hypothetical protein